MLKKLMKILKVFEKRYVIKNFNISINNLKNNNYTYKEFIKYNILKFIKVLKYFKKFK